MKTTTTGISNQNEPKAAPEENLAHSLQRYLQLLLKRKWLILSTIVVILGAVAVWTFSRTKIYQATTTVMVERRAPQVLGTQVNEVVDLSSGMYWENTEYMETQLKVITSKALSTKIAQQLNLVANKTFWGPQVKEKSANQKEKTHEDAAKMLRGSISAIAVRKTNLIEISVAHPDAQLATRLANAVTQGYLEQNLEYKHSSTTGAVKWLSNQLDDLKKQLEASEMALYEFKKNHNIISLSLEDKQNILARQIEKITDAHTELRMKRLAVEAQRKQIVLAKAEDKSGDPLNLAVGSVMENQVIQQLKEVLIKERREYEAILARGYLEKHPLVLEQKAKVVAARESLEREVKTFLSASEGKYREIRDNETQIAATLQQFKTEALELNKREVSYQRLERTQKNAAKLYELVLTRMKESDLSSQLKFNNIRLLDAAVAPIVPISPRVRRNLLIGAILGLFLGVGLAFMVDNLDNSVKAQEDIEDVPGLVCLGVMPKIPGSPTVGSGKRPAPVPELDLIVHRNPKSAVAESCRSIRTNLMFAATDHTIKSIMVSSPGPKEGKTTTTVSLAITMAQAGSRVIIVDTDMRRPRMHKIFGVPGGKGITSVLLGDSKVGDMIKTTEIPNLYVLPCGPIPPNPAELCQGERFKELVNELKTMFDRVILDSPPVMVVTDATVLSTIADGSLIVVRTGTTTRTGLSETVHQITDVGGKLLGCVLNDMDLKRRGYGYYRYRKYGYYRYGYSRYGYGQYGDKEEETSA